MIGGIVSHYCRQALLPLAKIRTKKTTLEMISRKGLLIASGFIVGESLIGVFIAGAIAYSGKAKPFSMSDSSFDGYATVLGCFFFLWLIIWMYKQQKRIITKIIE